MPDRIRKNDVVVVCVEQLARAKKFTSKDWTEELLSRTPGPVQDQHRVRYLALGIMDWLAEGYLMLA